MSSNEHPSTKLLGSLDELSKLFPYGSESDYIIQQLQVFNQIIHQEFTSSSISQTKHNTFIDNKTKYDHALRGLPSTGLSPQQQPSAPPAPSAPQQQQQQQQQQPSGLSPPTDTYATYNYNGSGGNKPIKINITELSKILDGCNEDKLIGIINTLPTDDSILNSTTTTEPCNDIIIGSILIKVENIILNSKGFWSETNINYDTLPPYFNTGEPLKRLRGKQEYKEKWVNNQSNEQGYIDRPDLFGLENFVNTCFMNAAIFTSPPYIRNH